MAASFCHWAMLVTLQSIPTSMPISSSETPHVGQMHTSIFHIICRLYYTHMGLFIYLFVYFYLFIYRFIHLLMCQHHRDVSAPPRCVSTTEMCQHHPDVPAPPRCVSTTQTCQHHPDVSAPPRRVSTTQICQHHPDFRIVRGLLTDKSEICESGYVIVWSDYVLVWSDYVLVWSDYVLLWSDYVLVWSDYVLVWSDYVLVWSDYVLVWSDYVLVWSNYVLVWSDYVLVWSGYVLVWIFFEVCHPRCVVQYNVIICISLYLVNTTIFSLMCVSTLHVSALCAGHHQVV